MRSFVILVASVLVLSVAAKDSICIGTLADGTDFLAEKHFFGKRIERFDRVPDKLQLCLRFVETIPPLGQELALYDVSEHRMKWRTEVDFTKDYYIPTSQGVVLQSGKSTLLLDEKGSICWEKKKFRPAYADVRNGVVLGYPKKKSNELMGVSLTKGQNLWTSILSHKGGWSEVMPLEDGRLLISADMICVLDPLTGKMLTKTVDNYRSSSRQALINAGVEVVIGGVLAGLLGVTVATAITCSIPAESHYLHHLNSNFYVDDGYIYYADRNLIRCMNDKLRIIWEKELPKKASMSRIYIQEDTLFFENTGWGENFKGDFYGDTRPYIMRYDRRDGTELSERETLKDEENFVYCYLKEPDKPYFTPRRLTVEEMQKQKKNGIGVYQTDRSLSLTHRVIFCDKDYWIVDLAGNVLLHFTKPILQTEVMDNVLVGLTDQNVIFQFDLRNLI